MNTRRDKSFLLSYINHLQRGYQQSQFKRKTNCSHQEIHQQPTMIFNVKVSSRRFFRFLNAVTNVRFISFRRFFLSSYRHGLPRFIVEAEAVDIITCKRTYNFLFKFVSITFLFRLLSDIKAEYPHHTHHKHHTEKIPDVKIIEVPVVKEVKVLQPYKVPYKVPVPYIVKQDIHPIPVHSHPVHTSQHVHHAPTKHFSHDSGKSFSASNAAPVIVSHTPAVQSSHDSTAAFSQYWSPKGIQVVSSQSLYPSTRNSRLYTSVQASPMGFGASEGKLMSFDGKGASNQRGYYFDGHTIKQHEPEFFGNIKAEPYPYPFAAEHTSQLSGKSMDYDFGAFTPSSYDFIKSFQ